MTDPILWQGEHRFLISGTERDDTTLRVATNGREDLYSLELPTLAITYADMDFAESIGGRQADYPDSQEYGVFFNPPVELHGGQEIEKFTWIRGAEELSIGPRRTIIRWRGFRDLVIPRLRIDASASAEAVLSVPEVLVTVEEPLAVDVMQSIDGRPVGGLSLVKRHPHWQPEPEPNTFDLRVGLVEASSCVPLAGVEVRLLTLEGDRSQEEVNWTPEGTWLTDDFGAVSVEGLPLSAGKLVVVADQRFLPATWRFLPLPDERVARVFRLQLVRRTWVAYRWRLRDTLREIAILTATEPTLILRRNGVSSESELEAGQPIEIPAIEPEYVCVVGDSLESLTSRFCYESAEELAAANDLEPGADLFGGLELSLPGWWFFVAPGSVAFEALDQQFEVPHGWSRPVLDTFHDDPAGCQPGEPVAVPRAEFVESHELRRA